IRRLGAVEPVRRNLTPDGSRSPPAASVERDTSGGGAVPPAALDRGRHRAQRTYRITQPAMRSGGARYTAWIAHHPRLTDPHLHPAAQMWRVEPRPTVKLL